MNEILILVAVIAASALAIALLVGLNRLLGGWRPAQIETVEDAVREIETGVSGFRAGAPVAVAADGRAALACEAGGARLGLALAMGDRITVRALAPGDVKSVTRQDARLTLKLADYTLATAEICFVDEDEAARFEAIAQDFIAGAARPAANELHHA